MRLIKETEARSCQLRQRARCLLVFSLMTAISAGMATSAQAQTFAEWFAQKKTQKKYLLQQIAALQVYSGYLKQGYSIAASGLGHITDYLHSENTLHTAYYARLKTADPVVKNNPMVKDILAWQQDILKKTREISQVSGLSAAEKDYLGRVGAAVLKDCEQQLNILRKVTGNDQLEMSDAERLALITKIHSAIQSNYRFTSAFANQVKVLALRRNEDQNQTTALQRAYQIN